MPTAAEQHAAAAFQVCSDPNRLRIILAIAAAPGLPVSALAASLGMHPAAASRHLATLRNVGFVGSRPAGRLRQYVLMPCAWPLVDAARKIVSAAAP